MNIDISKGVSFDNIHSFNDLDLIFAGAEIPPATPKENYIDVPGADSSLDLTEALGEVKYNDRSGCKFTFTMNPEGDLSDEAFEAKKTEISNLLNGTVRKITLDKDPDYYYYGRCTVNGYAQDKKIKQFVISAKVKPYKYKQSETTVFVHLCGKNLLDISSMVGETFSVNTNGTYSLYKSNGNRYSKKINIYIPANTSFTMSFDEIERTSSNTLMVQLYLSDNTSAYIAMTDSVQTREYNTDVVGIRFYLQSNENDGVSITFDKFQIEFGSEATDYEPYQIISPQNVILPNSRKTVVPVINCTNETTITFKENDYSLSAGTHKILDLQLYKGDNPITVDGTGLVTFTYQEGEL